MKIYIHRIDVSSFVDGPGERTVLYVQGCPIQCAGCQNPDLWSLDSGRLEEVEDVAETLATISEKHGNVTISGGEPFAQPAALAQLVVLLRKYGVNHILVYSGYTWETLLSPLTGIFPWMREILERIDVLVDGPYLSDKGILSKRGSLNQRPIDVAASLEAGLPVVLQWDAAEAVFAPKGYLPLAVELPTPIGRSLHPAQICGRSA